jgi:pimeloyl-ACP methyl ester carboxylesterase
VGKYGELRNGPRPYYSDQGAGDPVVLLHGGGVNSDSWYSQIPALAEHYHLLAPDAPATATAARRTSRAR